MPAVPGPVTTRRRLVEGTLLFLVVAAGRWALAYDGTIPMVAHDEFAQLAIARVVSGAGAWTMADLATWQPGFGLLIAPLARIFHEPADLYRSALLVNCLLGAVGAVVFAALVRRGLSAGVTSYTFGTVAAAIVMLSPALIRTSALVWAEPAVFLTFTATLLLLVETKRSPRLLQPVGAVFASSLGYLFHSRLLPVTIVATLIVGYLMWPRSRGRALSLVVVAAILLVAVHLVSAAIIDRVWTDPADLNSVGATLSRLRDPLAVVIALIGQVWYLQASTLGLFAMGAVVTVAACMRRPWATAVIPTDVARITGALVGVAMASSALFMSERAERGDYPIYGRYNDAVVGLVVVVGLVCALRLARASVRRYLAMVALSLTATFAAVGTTVMLRQDIIDSSPIAREMVTGIAPFVIGPPRDLVAVTLASAVVSVVVYLSIGRSWSTPIVSLAVATVLLAGGGIRVWDVFQHSRSRFANITVAAAVDDIVPEGLPIGIQLPPVTDGYIAFGGPRLELGTIQFVLPTRTIVPVEPGPTQLEYVFGTRDASDLEAAGDIAWSDPDVFVVLWRIPP